jgi:hypothetical protein
MWAVLDRLRAEGSVMKQAPFAFIIVLSVGLAAGYEASSWYYGKNIRDQTALVSRYQIVLGLKEPSESAMVQLKNEELRAMTMRTVAESRQILFSFQKKEEARMDQVRLGTLAGPAAANILFENTRQLGQDFTQELRSDISLEDKELRRRLPNKDQRGVVLEGTNEPLWKFVPDSMAGMMVEQTVNDIEEMAKLLPED